MKQSNQLWTSFINGDTASFEQIYSSHISYLFEYGTRLTADEEKVKDLIQEMFLRLWVNRNRLGNVRQVRWYLARVLRNMVYDKSRSRQRQLSVINQHFGDGGLEYSDPINNDYNAALTWLEKEYRTLQMEKVQNAIKELTVKQRAAVSLRYISMMSFNEIGDALQVSSKAASKLASRGIQSLRRHLHLIPASW